MLAHDTIIPGIIIPCIIAININLSGQMVLSLFRPNAQNPVIIENILTRNIRDPIAKLICFIHKLLYIFNTIKTFGTKIPPNNIPITKVVGHSAAINNDETLTIKCNIPITVNITAGVSVNMNNIVGFKFYIKYYIEIYHDLHFKYKYF